MGVLEVVCGLAMMRRLRAAPPAALAQAAGGEPCVLPFIALA